MKALGIGLGSIGQRHFNNLHKHHPEIDLIACRHRNNKLLFLDDTIFKSYEKLCEAFEENPEIALITNPTSLHIPYAIEAAKHGCHLFIEKPLSHNLDGVDALINIVEKNNLITYMACNLRFLSCIKKVKQLIYDNAIGDIYSVRAVFGSYLPDWHPWEDYHQSYASKSELGGGVILTCIHEIDYLYWLFGDVDRVFSTSNSDSKLGIDVEESSDMIMKFKSDIVANVHMDFLSIPYRRGCKIIGKSGTIYWDFSNNEVGVYGKSTKRWEISRESVDFNQSYVDEMEHFLECVNNKKETINTIKDSKRVLEIALAIKKSSMEEKWIRL